ncbi:MAG: ABC transporter permease [Nocardioides alkalitolerans]
MSTATAVRQVVATEAKLVWRDPAGVFLPLALPALIIVMSGLTSEEGGVDGTGIPAASAIGIPNGFGTIVAILALVNMPSFLASYRSEGVLRRLAVTPARPSWVLLGQVTVNAVLGIVGTILSLVVVATVFELVAPRLLLWTVLAALLTTAAMYGIGLVLAALVPSSSSATAVGLVVFLGMLTLGGGTVPPDVLPDVLTEIGRVLPFGAGTQAMQSAWLGDVPEARDLLTLAATAVVPTLVATRVFRWK